MTLAMMLMLIRSGSDDDDDETGLLEVGAAEISQQRLSQSVHLI